MKLSKYIFELLREHETVIIPGFGAFISDYKPAEINTETEEISPPSKKISFSTKIRNNDGLLVGHIAESEEISHFDALKRIEKERENLIYRLDKGEKVTIENTGILFYNENQEIRFEPTGDENLLLESFGLVETSLKPSPEKMVEEEILAEVPEQTNTEETIVEVYQDTEVSETSPAAEPEEIITETPWVVEPEQVGAKSEIETHTKPVREIQPDKKKGKKKNWFLYLLILIPIIAAGIFIVSNNKRQTKNQIEGETSSVLSDEVVKETLSVTDSLQNDSTLNMSIDSTEMLQSAVQAGEIYKKISPNFYLVGGSFKAENNAEKYLLELKEKGYKPFHLGKKGSFYIVGIGTYNTEGEAIEAKREFLLKNPGSGTWILEE